MRSDRRLQREGPAVRFTSAIGPLASGLSFPVYTPPAAAHARCIAPTNMKHSPGSASARSEEALSFYFGQGRIPLLLGRPWITELQPEFAPLPVETSARGVAASRQASVLPGLFAATKSRPTLVMPCMWKTNGTPPLRWRRFHE